MAAKVQEWTDNVGRRFVSIPVSYLWLEGFTALARLADDTFAAKALGVDRATVERIHVTNHGTATYVVLPVDGGTWEDLG